MLFGELGAVPGVGDAFEDAVVVVQAAFGDAAAQGIVEVVPAPVVGCGDVGEAVFGVPGEVPGEGLAAEGGDLAADDAPLGVVVVVGASGRCQAAAV
ncbi:hypothetical protein Srubr_20030 [Streptomyces rubradiris]|uniref:Uncharacterized protein n=1 Tax=Streptomyces rubradiris TaxID=285531 RepID=A0ABQ3R8L0_STRRR|nr:hypothetical protein GCM10018792_59770 [Streptomyces rubradiris]GHI52157.1 hypothetical protein Srubr_20030 [Streptomyces rubradiris]